ncbi:MAG: methyltransferase domain-containing protein [Leptospiraceae bacterium]|nr:methyltransferase domain-containing protein [Leptospiraceae bacterium]
MKTAVSILKKAHYHEAEKKILESVLMNLRLKGLQSLLDVGCGNGNFASLLTKTGFDFKGVDINPEMLEEAKKNGHRPILFSDLEKSQECFDVILISHVIEHIRYDDLINFINFYLDRLNKNGILILVSPLLTDNFYYDFTHERPYYPQAIWQMFGDYYDSLSIKKTTRIQLEDIYFVKDSFRTRKWRSYYLKKTSLLTRFTKAYNLFWARVYLLSGYYIGKKVSWIGIYSKTN